MGETKPTSTHILASQPQVLQMTAADYSHTRTTEWIRPNIFPWTPFSHGRSGPTDVIPSTHIKEGQKATNVCLDEQFNVFPLQEQRRRVSNIPGRPSGYRPSRKEEPLT